MKVTIVLDVKLKDSDGNPYTGKDAPKHIKAWAESLLTSPNTRQCGTRKDPLDAYGSRVKVSVES